jgi:hypothetical protein
MDMSRLSKPRCFLLYALAPEDWTASQANKQLNALVADRSLPLAVFHDHFIGSPGGLVVYYAEDAEQRAALVHGCDRWLTGWRTELRPLIFSSSPSALDEQIAFTLRTYRDTDWQILRQDRRPSYGDPAREAETAAEEVADGTAAS